MIRYSKKSVAIAGLGLLLAAAVVIAVGASYGTIAMTAIFQTSWRDTVGQIRAELSRGNDDEALRLIQPLLAANQKREEIEEVCMELGKGLADEGKRDAAEPLLRKTLEIREALHGAENLQVVEASFLLAQLYLSKASVLQIAAANREASEYLDQAERLLDTALQTRERLSGPKSVGVSDVLQQLTVLCLQRHGFAETACPENFERRKRIAEILTGNLPPTHPDWAKALYSLADSQEARVRSINRWFSDRPF